MTFRTVPDTELQWIKIYRQSTEIGVVVTFPAQRFTAMLRSGQVVTSRPMKEFSNVDRSELRVRERGVGFELKSDDGGHDPRS